MVVVMPRDLRQMSLADGVLNQRAGRNEWLDRIGAIIDWSAVSLVLSKVYSSDEGRPSYPVLTLVKLRRLQQWYGLSDPGLEEAVDDRLSFRRFAGLPLDEGVPDHSTIWRFRQALQRHGLAEALFAEINRQLDARGLIVRKGTLIDATIVEAAVKPPSGQDGALSDRDPQAGWTTKNGKSHFGYKAHIAVDEGSGLIRAAMLSAADLHDSQAGPALAQGDEAAVYADKASDNQAFRTALGEAGFDDGIMSQARRNTAGLGSVFARAAGRQRPGRGQAGPLGASVAHLVELGQDLERRRVALRVLNLGIDTGIPVGRRMFTIVAGIAEFRTRSDSGAHACRPRGGSRP